MDRKTWLAIIATVALAACVGSGGPSPAGPLAYSVPTPPTAVYQITDTMAITMDTPAGSMEITTGSSVTLAMTFERATDGVRVTGSVESFDASATNPMSGTESVDDGDVSGTLEFVLDRRGDVEVASLPELSGAAAQMSPFASIAHELFPRLPDDVVEPGDTWVDTVTWTTEMESMETTSSAVLTFTLVGDTLVDGRTLLNFAVASEVEGGATVEQGGMAITQSMAGSSTGFVLWDTERGLPAYEQAERNLEGTTTVAGMPPFPMRATGTTRVRLDPI